MLVVVALEVLDEVLEVVVLLEVVAVDVDVDVEVVVVLLELVDDVVDVLDEVVDLLVVLLELEVLDWHNVVSYAPLTSLHGAPSSLLSCSTMYSRTRYPPPGISLMRSNSSRRPLAAFSSEISKIDRHSLHGPQPPMQLTTSGLT